MTEKNEATVDLSILRCRGCGRLGVALNDKRITAHKCAGAWHEQHHEKIPARYITEALASLSAPVEAEGGSDG